MTKQAVGFSLHRSASYRPDNQQSSVKSCPSGTSTHSKAEQAAGPIIYEEPKTLGSELTRISRLSTPYATLAGLAGYIMKAGDAPESKEGMDAFWFRGEGLTEDDMVDILAIIEAKERRRKKN